jgi:hypothetical protein
MNDAPKTAAESHIETLMEQLEPGSDRYRVLDVARRFKSSWVELGEELLRVNQGSLYQHWGYASFEEYCQKEIRIRKPTAQKLTRAYRFISKEEPQLLAEKSPLTSVPDYRSIDLLRQAREEHEFSEEDYATLRQTVIDQERSHPTAVKCFKSLAPEPEPDGKERLRLYKKALSAARRLSDAVEQMNDVPPGHRDVLYDILKWLDAETASATEDVSSDNG